MINVKITADTDEELQSAGETLIKAFEAQEGTTLEESRFDDHLMNLLTEDLDAEYLKMYSAMFSSIIGVLNSDHH